jgi:putative ABC transport system permease protein
MFAQIASVTWLNLANLRSRLGASTIIVVGVAGVVAVLLGLLAMSAGFRSALVDTAKQDRALIVRNGSNNEMGGWVSADELALIETYEAIDVASGEVYVTFSVTKRGVDTTADVVARGVTPAAFALRPEVEIIRGRSFAPGKDEIIVGVKAAAQYAGLGVGDAVQARSSRWTVVGHFAAAGTAVESEIWLDLPVAQDVFRRAGVVSVVRARLTDSSAAPELSRQFTADPRLPLAVVPETEFFAAQSAARAALIDTFAYFVAGIMAVGSVLAALNTMYTAVDRRTVEIAALGVGAWPGRWTAASAARRPAAHHQGAAWRLR